MPTQEIFDTVLDEERALYGLRDAMLSGVTFAGPADGESALKECAELFVDDCTFELRYPLWHTDCLIMNRSTLTSTCRAAIWYGTDIRIEHSELLGIKALRACTNAALVDCRIASPEFGWECDHLALTHCSIDSEYAFLHTGNLRLTDCMLTGKYSFQYTHDLIIDGGTFDTKDAFWHATNVTVRNATLKGEYLGWYSDGLTLENCTIEGTQPLVNCRNLRLLNCQMVGCDLAFEGSDVEATIRGGVDSIRDPRSGTIELDSVGEVVHDTLGGCGAEIVVREPEDENAAAGGMASPVMSLFL